MIPWLAPALLLLAGASVGPRAGGPALPARAQDSGDQVIYETAAGDTLAGLAEAHFRAPEDWQRARALNAALLGGVGPRAPLPAGLRLRLDTGWLRHAPASAEIVAFRGDVRVESAGQSRPARLGLRVHEGEAIATGPVGFVTLRLPDGTEVALPTATAVRFDRLRRYSLNGALDRRIRILEGRVTSRVVPLPDPTSRHEVTTPVGVAAVRGTEFRVSFTPQGQRATAGVLEGRVGVTAGAAAERMLGAGTGVVFGPAGPGAVVRLPAPPVALAMPAVQAGPEARFAVRPLPGLAFRAVIATDPDFRNPVAEAESADGRFALEGLPAGRYHLMVTAVTPDGLEGLPARFSFDRPREGAAVAASGPAAGGAAGTAGGDGGAEPPAGAARSGDLGEGLAAVARPVAKLYAETLGGREVEEGDGGEAADVTALADMGSTSPPARWSLGAGRWPAAWGVELGIGRAGAGGAGVLAVSPDGFGGIVPWGSGARDWALPPAVRPFAAAFPSRASVAAHPMALGELAPAVATSVPPEAAPVVTLQPAPSATGARAALVPEPKVWAMLLAGFGLVGLALRRARARAEGVPGARAG
nr:FecR domain-containing protein [Thermaurantiacus tibetensis]